MAGTISLGLFEAALVSLGGAAVGEFSVNGFDTSPTGLGRAVGAGLVAFFLALGYGGYTAHTAGTVTTGSSPPTP